MKFIDDIFSFIWDISDFFYAAFVEVNGWVWPLNLLAPPLLALCNVFWDLLTPIAHLGDWVDDVADKVADILNWDIIKSNILTWLPKLEATVTWFLTWADSVLVEIKDWWSETFTTVQGWIAIATEGLSALLVAWDNFLKVTLPTLFDLSYAEEWYKSKLVGVADLIKSAFTEHEDLWCGWVDFRQGVSDFFADPLEWLWSRFTDWFLGPEG